MKYGRIPSHEDSRTLQMSRYLSVDQLPASPPARNWTFGVPKFGMFQNDILSDCTCASIAHAMQALSVNTGRDLKFTDDDVVDLYKRAGRYDPKDPATDQGAEMIDVLKEMRNGGFAGLRFGAFVQVDPANQQHHEAAVNVFGWEYCGVDLPIATTYQKVWDVGDGPDFVPNSRGPHAMAKLGYNRLHDLYITWAGPQIATRKWSLKYTSETWAAVESLWIDDTSGLTPSGFDLKQLLADLYEIDRNK